MKLETIAATKLSTAECRQLRSLTLRKKGELAELLTDWRYDSAARVVRMWDDSDTLVAWGIAVPYDYRGNKDVQLYVRKSERRKGYGKAVYQRLRNSAGGRSCCIVHPHSVESVAFFNEVQQKPLNLPLFEHHSTKENSV